MGSKAKEFSPDKVSVSFSGGRTSAYMSYLIQKNWGHTKQVQFVFANTGKENEQTLEFVDKCDKEWGLNVVWLEAEISPERGIGTRYKQVTFETASRNGEPFEAMIRKYGIPNVIRATCTRELKANTMQSFRRENFPGAMTAIGIRRDEFDRMNPERKSLGLIYPLISEWPSTKADVKKFWGTMPFDLGLKDYEGNCDLCFKKGDFKLVKILQADPSKVDWWDRMEREYGTARIETQKRPEASTFYRANRSAMDILKISKANRSSLQMNLFSDLDACGSGESCEPF